MRISDWSSDVCSSDLFAGEGLSGRPSSGALRTFDRLKLRLDRQPADRRGGGALQEGGLRLLVQHQRRILGAVEPAKLARLVAAHLVAQRRARQEQVLLAEGPGDVVVLEQHPHLGVERSEEHTSELQSLMRISYAVFCLK